MEYLIGALGAAAFFVCLFLAYKAGQRSRRPTAHKEVNDDDRRKAEAIRNGFVRLMNYDVDTALKRQVK